ncbi:penicillin-binding transpeptidase domain-containing protein [Cellulomonas hominis]
MGRGQGRAGRTWIGAVAALGVMTVGVLAGCTGGPPGPQDTADALAAALTSGDFGDVAFAAGDPTQVTEERKAVFAGLAPWEPAVRVESVATDKGDDSKATATLAYTWDVDASPNDWTYSTHAALTRVDDDWQVTWSSFVLAPDLVEGETLGVRRVTAERADVLGAGGAVLVEPRAVSRIGIDKTRVDAAGLDAVARGLAAALGMDPDAYATRVAEAGPKAFVEAIVVRATDQSYDVPALAALPGVNVVADELPLAPTRTFARPVLGTVGDATAEIVDASKGAVVAGDLTGLSGLQRQYDAQLRGLPGLTVVATTAAGATRELFHVEPTAGQPLQTTIDPVLQQSAEDILAPVGPASAIVAIRPSTGDVLAVASGPGGGGLSTATVGSYAPGSTFKVVSALALLRHGSTVDTPMSCTPTVTVDGREFANYPGYPSNRLGDIPMRTALANSCNTAFISAGDQVAQTDLVSAAASLGLGGDPTLGFAAFMGSVPGDSTGTEHAASMIGQGRVEASPLAMATVAASVVQGARVTPHLVAPAATADDPTPAPVATDGATAGAGGAPAVDAAPLTADEATALRSMMRGVVTEGSAGFLADVPGAEVIAKSGTAEFGTGDDLSNHVWMIAGQGDLAVAVFVEVGDFGTTTAGPLLEAFLRAAAG